MLVYHAIKMLTLTALHVYVLTISPETVTYVHLSRLTALNCPHQRQADTLEDLLQFLDLVCHIK